MNKQWVHCCILVVTLVTLIYFVSYVFDGASNVTRSPAADCYWNISINTNKPGSLAVKNVTTVAQCMQHCSQNLICTGFDFTSESNDGTNCWVSEERGFEIVYNRAHKVTHYQKVCGKERPKDEECSWTLLPNKHTSGSVLMDHIQKKEDCLNECASIWNCRAVDWNENNLQENCWLSSDHDVKSYMAYGISHYDKTCGRGLSTRKPTTAFGPIIKTMITECHWNVYKDHYSPYGVLKSSYTKLKSCKNACIADQSCFSIDWSEKSEECWFSTSEKFYEKQGFKHCKYVCKMAQAEIKMGR